jgi:two-component system, NtrC family, nitrogen regulation sensor histidine kinase GlnL
VSQPHPDLLATGLIRIDQHGRILWLNRAAADYLGRSPDSVTGTELAGISPTLGRWNLRMRQLQRPLQATEAQLECSDQTLDVLFQLIDEHSLIELHPVAERIRQREMTERADRQQAVSLLSRRLAHELRNPLAGVRGAAQLIESAGSDPDLERHARMIQREVDRITRLIDHFATDNPQRMESVNLHQVLDEAGELIMAEQHGRLDLKKSYDPSIPDLRASGGQLHQLVLNLLRNSSQAGATRIELKTRIEHHSPLVDNPVRHAVRIDIDDDGEGVPESLRDRLFLPLVSGRDQGSGFGLAVAQQIARGHGGLVEYEPLSHGSRFRIRLPLVAAEDRQHD